MINQLTEILVLLTNMTLRLKIFKKANDLINNLFFWGSLFVFEFREKGA
jgi:hypothetical protein